MVRRSNKLTEKELGKGNVNRATDVTYKGALDKFLKACQMKNLRPDTIKYYQRELEKVERRLGMRNVNQITAETIEENIIGTMLDEGLKPTTVNATLRALRSFFNYLHKKKIMKYNPMESIEQIRFRRQAPPTFTKSEVKKLLGILRLDTFTGLRDYTLILFLLETGVRVNELVHIDIEDVDLSVRRVTVRHTKNQYARTVPFGKKLANQLKRYLAIRGECPSPALFVTLEGTRLARQTVKTQLLRIGRKAGVKCAAHKFRHTFAKWSVLNGANVFDLQAILGHSSLEMVKVYVNLYSPEVSKRQEGFSPLDSL